MIKTLIKISNSNMIYAVGYDSAEKILEVVFMSGKIWVYEDVPKEEYENLMKASSMGSYMRSCIIGCYSDYEIS